MGLHGKHILIDGYNLALPQGTGIKTYARGLIEALRGLGATVSVLWSARRNRVPVVQEALLHENSPSGVSWTQLAFGTLRSLMGLSLKATEHLPGGWVIPRQPGDGPAIQGHRSYLLPGGYALANFLFGYTGLVLRTRLPERIDLWHATYPLPVRVRGARTVTTVHDLIPLRLPWATRDDRGFFYRLVQQALDRSDLVLTDSESARNDILEICKPSPGQVEVLYPAVAAPSVPLPEEVLSRRLRVYGLQPQSYLLFVGAIEPRKNLGRLCQALAQLDHKVPLVIVGPKSGSWPEELRPAQALQAAKKVLILDHVPGEALAALYAGALVFVFPSLYEGFGLPPLEAMAHGCPVLASNVSSLPEVCGDAALYADPNSVSDLAEKLDALIRDERLREGLKGRAREQAERYSMANHRSRLLELYGKVLS